MISELSNIPILQLIISNLIIGSATTHPKKNWIAYDILQVMCHVPDRFCCISIELHFITDKQGYW